MLTCECEYVIAAHGIWCERPGTQTMVTRRALLTLCGTLVGAAALRRPLAAGEGEHFAPILNDDGLYQQTWFLESFLDLAEDLTEAGAGGKRFAIMWEQRGCPYCQETHLVNFAQPEIQTFVRRNFDILQLNIFGSRSVTDFDGEELEERALARKAGVRFTPTVQFFTHDPAAALGKPVRDAEIARMPGYLRPPHFLAMFKYVQSRAYEQGSFRQFLKKNAA